MTAAALLAIGAPTLIGRLALTGVRFSHVALRWANSFLLGCAILSATLVAVGRVGWPVSPTSVALVVALLTAAAAAMALMRGRLVAPPGGGPGDAAAAGDPPERRPQALARIAAMVLALLVVVRVASAFAAELGSATILTDAYENWLLRAKVIHGLQRVPLERGSPFYLAGGRTSYPLGMPMLAAWSARFGPWSERAAGVLWPAYYAATVALVGGAAAARLGGLPGLLAAYALSSVPLLSVHAVCPGYADLLLAAHLTAACLGAWNWFDSRRRSDLLIAAGQALFCVLLKREGLMLAGLGVLATGLLTLRQTDRQARRFAGIVCGVWLACAAALFMLVDVRFLRAEIAALGWHPEAVSAMVRRLFAWDTWGLWWWVIVPLLLAAAICRIVRRCSAAAPTADAAADATADAAADATADAAADATADAEADATAPTTRAAPLVHAWALIAFVAFVFACTDNAQFAVNGMTFDRSTLQIAPVVGLAVLHAWSRDRPGPSGQRAA